MCSKRKRQLISLFLQAFVGTDEIRFFSNIYACNKISSAEIKPFFRRKKIIFLLIWPRRERWSRSFFCKRLWEQLKKYFSAHVCGNERAEIFTFATVLALQF